MSGIDLNKAVEEWLSGVLNGLLPHPPDPLHLGSESVSVGGVGEVEVSSSLTGLASQTLQLSNLDLDIETKWHVVPTGKADGPFDVTWGCTSPLSVGAAGRVSLLGQSFELSGSGGVSGAKVSGGGAAHCESFKLTQLRLNDTVTLSFDQILFDLGDHGLPAELAAEITKQINEHVGHRLETEVPSVLRSAIQDAIDKKLPFP